VQLPADESAIILRQCGGAWLSMWLWWKCSHYRCCQRSCVWQQWVQQTWTEPTTRLPYVNEEHV